MVERLASSKEVIAQLEVIAADFSEDTIVRQKRRQLEVIDFERIAEAGFLMTGVPLDRGGLWQRPSSCIRDYSRMVRVLAHGDPSVALVSAMHPAVSAFFLAVEEVDDEPEAWAAQRQQIFDSASREWWGTIMSEPGSGGDIMRTKTLARQSGKGYLLTGDKHFGSGSGHATNMITTGICKGSDKPEMFYLSYKDEPWDGSTGCKMMVEWDGMGMSATQSHAFRFTDFPVTKMASSQVLERSGFVSSQMSGMLFVGVVLGVADKALEFARGKLTGKHDGMRGFERVEWSRCENELWLAEQAYEGALRAIENEESNVVQVVLRCKITCAELIESALARMAKVVGGASYSRAMPLAQWTEDVKALGFLRPPLPLAYDQLFAFE